MSNQIEIDTLQKLGKDKGAVRFKTAAVEEGEDDEFINSIEASEVEDFLAQYDRDLPEED